MNILDYTTSTVSHLESAFKTSAQMGLNNQQIAALKKQYGANALIEKETSWISLLLRQFTNPLMYMLTGAACLSFFLESKTNALLIIAIVIINGLLSFYQEYRAYQAVQLLKAHLTHFAEVLRNGKRVRISSSELVPGDIVFLGPGDRVPVDVRLISGSLAIDESIVTGESAPVKKVSDPQETPALDSYQASNIAFLATTVTGGSATGLVLATGSSTLMGRVSQLTVGTTHKSGFQERLARLSTFLIIVIGITLTGLFIFHLILHGRNTDIIQLLLFSIALSLGLTPEALPAVTTFALSRGALQLAQHHVVVKRLSAIEDLGAITILCTDKTGTLTENKLSVETIMQTDENLLPYALLVVKSSPPLDPFDTAFLAYASDETKKEAATYTRLGDIPFDPLRTRSSVLVSKNNESILIVRGAVDVIEGLCTGLTQNAERQRWIESEAQQGNRVLAVAYRKVQEKTIGEDLEKDLTFAGLIAFHDPIKSTTITAVAKAHALGITLKMITGDSKEVACAVAKQIGLTQDGCRAVSGAEFAKLSPEEKSTAVITSHVFARISPEQKYEIINLLRLSTSTLESMQSTGHQAPAVVGFLGDGINDAPALKAAHVALAVQGASDIARDAADIILLKKSLLVIIDGIAIGRQVFANTIKYIIATLSSTSGNFYSMAVASLLLPFLPQLPLQILLVNLLSDLPMISIATDTVDAEELKKPHDYSLKEIAFISVVLGVVNSLFDFMFFAIFYHAAPSVLQSNWFILNVLTELMLIYSVRTRLPFFKAQFPSYTLIILTLLSAAVTLMLPFTYIGQHLFSFTQPTGTALLIIAALVATYFIATETVKLLYFRFTGNTGHPLIKT